MTPNLGNMPIDLQRLLESRLLVQATSGGGKSHALRRVLEQTAPLVQQLVIDPEGEFATLREKFDYIICAPSGADAVATPKTAAALAVALWKSGSSAIIDIYELARHDRVLFVRRFCEALIAAPKSAWHQTIIALDEIQDYAPETGKAESAGAVVDVAARGRKRGLCLIGATQRIARLSKDVAAELQNKAIGMTTMDVDVRRAMTELGMSNYKEAFETLRTLEPGEFFVYGPALSRTVERTRIGPVVTTHPKIGHRTLLAPPPASSAVKAQLAKLEGLQLEAVNELKTVDELRAEVTKLRRELTNALKTQPAPAQVGHTDAQVQALIAAALGQLQAPLAEALEAQDRIKAGAEALRIPLAAIMKATLMVAGLPRPIGPLPDARTMIFGPAQITEAQRRDKARDTANALIGGPDSAGHQQAEGARKRETARMLGRPTSNGVDIHSGITAPQQKILDVLAQLEMFGVDVASKPMVAAHAGVSPTSGGYFNNLGRLRSGGFIEYPAGGDVALTDLGKRAATYPTLAPTLEELHDSWLGILPAPQAAILRVLLDAHPRSIPKNDLADQVGVSRTSGGYFNNLGRLRTLGAIDYPEKGAARATDILFPKGAAS